MVKPKFAVIRQPARVSAAPPVGLFCNYSPRVCMRSRVEGYEYCLRHILEDKSSPYKQCTYVSNRTNRRCTSAVPRMEKRDGFCPEHARMTAQSRVRMLSKPRPHSSLHSILEELDHHVVRPPGVNDARSKAAAAAKPANRITDYVSSSDSEAETMTVGEIWKTDEESDMESIDSEQEDPLKHAGVYTAEEVASILRDKLIRLQSLYIDQFRYLHHTLREKRRKYLRALSQIKGIESTGDSSGLERMLNMTPADKAATDKLGALRHYHRRFGKEALLHRQCKERRIAFSEGDSYKAPVVPRCTSVKDDGAKCTGRALPLSKHCIEHIVSDKRQVLFRYCNHGDSCRRSVVMTDDSVSCDLHRQVQSLPWRFSRKREETEVKDEPVDVVGICDSVSERSCCSLRVDLDRDLPSDLSVFS